MGLCRGFVFVHDCSMFTKSESYPGSRQLAYGQVSSGRLTTIGVAVLRTTTHRNGSSFEGLISMCGRKVGTWMKSPACARGILPSRPSVFRRYQRERRQSPPVLRDGEFLSVIPGSLQTGRPR